MKYSKEVKLINELIDIAQLDGQLLKDGLCFGSQNGDIIFNGKTATRAFRKNLQIIHENKKEAAKECAYDFVERRLIDMVAILKKEKRHCTETEIENFYSLFSRLPLKEFEVYYEIHGIKMNADILNLGPFTIYNYEKYKDEFFSKHTDVQIFSRFWRTNVTHLLSTKATARDQRKAVELTDLLVRKFENVIYYMVGDISQKKSIGIFNYRPWKAIDRVLLTDTGASFSGNNQVSLPVQIDSPHFVSSKYGHDTIWSLITKTDRNDIENRLLNAIDWIGKAFFDLDSAKAYVQFVFAIEGMLKYDEGSFVSPSIANQLSEYTAFIVSETTDERIEIARTFKDMYRKRSAIAHGANTIIDFGDLALVATLAKQVTDTFLTVAPFCDMNNMADFNEYITKLKFR